MQSSPADRPPSGPAPDPATAAADQPAAAAPIDAPVVAPVDAPAPLRLRRAPRYRAFVLTGVLFGVLAALLATALAPPTGDGRSGSVLGYLAVSLGLLGGLVGAAAALVAERRRPVRDVRD